MVSRLKKGVNQNLGAESTIAYLLCRLAFEEVEKAVPKSSKVHGKLMSQSRILQSPLSIKKLKNGAGE